MLKKVLSVLSIITGLLALVALGFAEEAAQAMEAGRSGLLFIGAALAIGLPSLATGYAQAKIGAAGAGALAERPDLIGPIIIMIAIPETAVILGFVVSILLFVL